MRTTVTHLANRIGAEERTLRRAAEGGAIRCSRPSPRRIELTAEEEQYLRAHWPLLRRLRAALRTEPDVRFAAVFGSVATGQTSSESDLDLLVDLADDSWDRRQRLVTRLERSLDRPVDLLVLRRARRNPSLLSTALDQARVLVDRDAAWPQLLRQRGSLRRAAREAEALADADASAAIAELTAS